MLNSDDEDQECPLCMEELDIGDRNFKPCPCGYQVCRFCWHHIKENLNGRCPACRREYSEETVEFQPISADEIARIKREKKEKEREQKEMELANRKHLANMRVIQKNLAYVIGLHPKYATEEIIRSNDFFGQYGKISKLVINKRPALPSTTSATSLPPSVGIYVTYQRKEDAMKCIQAVDGTMVGGRILRASLGTTKYCIYYLRNVPCPNPACMYLHEPGDDADSISKEELASGKHKMRDSMSSDFGSRSHAFETRSFSSADNSPISSPAIHHSHRILSTIESVANISYKTPAARHETHKQSYFDDHSENSKPALPVTASWAKSVSGSSTPTLRHQHTQDLDVTSDNFGPSLAAAVALAQKAHNHGSKTKAEKKELKKAKRAAEQVSGKHSRTFQLPSEPDNETDADEEDEDASVSASSQNAIDPLVSFVLGMDASDMSVSTTDEPSTVQSIGIRALRDEVVVPDIKQEKDEEEQTRVQTGIDFLISSKRYNTSIQQSTFDPWIYQATYPSPTIKNNISNKGSPLSSGYRSPQREQATLLNGALDNASPKMVSAHSYLHSPNPPVKQTISDISSRSASLLSVLQPHVEQHSIRSTQLNAPPGISRQVTSHQPDSPQYQPRGMSPMAAFSNLAALNAAYVHNSSPGLQHLPPNLPLTQNIHEVSPHPSAMQELRGVNLLRQRSPQQTAQLLNHLTAPKRDTAVSSSTTVADIPEARGENRRLRVFQGMRGDNALMEDGPRYQDKKPEASHDLAGYMNSMTTSSSFSIREPGHMQQQQLNGQHFGAGSDKTSIEPFSRRSDLQFASHMSLPSASATNNATTPPGLVSAASSPKSSPYGLETPKFTGDTRFSPISLETLMASASNNKGNMEPIPIIHRDYNNLSSAERELQQAEKEAAQLQDRLRALIHKNKAAMFS
ncbi:transcriptional repressor proteinral negative regulator of transcription subunit 4 [Umbelopsis nana]